MDQNTTCSADLCVSENAVGSTTNIHSPSKRFSVTIQSYRIMPSARYCSYGVIKDGSEVITTIYRNYGTFFCSFFYKNAAEWLVCSPGLMSQTFINLETREVFERPSDCKDDFIWTSVRASPSGSLLLVDGCYWGSQYTYNMYDLSDPKKGWPLLPMVSDVGDDAYVDPEDHVQSSEIKFTSDTECVIVYMDRYDEASKQWFSDMPYAEKRHLIEQQSDIQKQLKIKLNYKLQLVDDKIVVYDYTPEQEE